MRVETLCGFQFVNLDAAAAPIGECFPEVAAGLREYLPHLDRLQPVEWVTAEERCNWKVSVENYSECYHCGVAHPSFTRGVIDPRRYDIRADGRCLRHTTTAVDRAAMSYAIDASDSEHAADYSSWFLWPAFSFQVYPGGMLNTYHWRPLAVDRTEVVRGWYAPAARATKRWRRWPSWTAPPPSPKM